MNKDEYNNYIKTSDLSLATTISLWQPLERIDKSNPLKASFVFKKNDAVTKLINDYWKRQLTVEPQCFFQQLRIIKARLYEE